MPRSHLSTVAGDTSTLLATSMTRIPRVLRAISNRVGSKDLLNTGPSSIFVHFATIVTVRTAGPLPLTSVRSGYYPVPQL